MEGTTEKVYCLPCQNNDAMAMAMFNQNNWNNNPFAYMMIMGMMRWMYGDNWQNQYAGNAEMQSRFNQLSNQMSDNHNTDILADFAKGNYARIGELATNLGVDLRAIQSGICDVRSGVQGLAGDVKAGFQGLQGDVRFTGERIINGNLLATKDLQAAVKDCCCTTQQNIQKFGYENQLAQKDTLNAMGQQTYTLNERLTGIANGLQQGFSAVAYESQRQTCDIINSGKDNTQRIIDVLNNHWQADLQQRYNDARLELSQKTQNEYLINQLKQNGCGCGC